MVEPKPEPKSQSANRILETALDLFATRGYEGTSVREICEAARITKPTLYYFYGSKEGVFRAIVSGALEEVKADLAAALGQQAPLVDRLKTITRNFFANATQQRKLWRFIASSMWMQHATHAPEIPCAYADYSKMLTDAIDDSVARGELRPGPTDIRLLVLLGAIGEALDRFLLFEEPPLTPALADQLVDVIVSGWLAPAAPDAVSARASSSASSSSSSSSPSSNRTL